MTNLAVDRRVGNLPAEVTSFVGRRRELAEAKRILEGSRLVTLTGVGGVGKTRLALRVAADVQRTFADGVWLVELSALREAKLLPRAVATALELPDRSADDPLDLLADYLGDRHLLLVLDTCEHLVHACAMLAEVLLRAAPRLKILTTSREPFEVIGESTLLVPPLETPDPERPDVADCDSVVLFTDRARATMPEFRVTPENRGAVARLCRRLDGIPLAIELATVRLRAMSVEQLVARIDNRFQLLGTARTSLERHQTLRAAVEWSHDLCTPAEQLLWARLAVFPGGFDLVAVEYVCSDEDLPADRVLDVLIRLVGKSIVLREDDGTRYRMLDTLREFGLERLDELDTQDELRRRHRDFYLRLAEDAAGAAGRDRRQLATLSRLRREQDNLRIALGFSLSTPGEESVGLRLAGALHLYWAKQGLYSEGRGWLTHALALVPGTVPIQGQEEHGAHPADRVNEQVTLAHRGRALYAAARLASWQADFAEAETAIDEAGRIADALGDAVLQANVIHVRGLITFLAGDTDGSRDQLAEAMAAHEALGWPDPMALTTIAFAGAGFCRAGEFEQALKVCEDGIRTCDALGERWARADIIWVRALAGWMSGNPRRALVDLDESLREKEAYGDMPGIAMSLDVIGACAVSLDDFERAATVFGATETQWETLAAPFAGPDYAEVRQATIDTAEQALGAEQFAAAFRRGREMSVAAAIRYARDETTAPAPATAARTDPLTKREREVAQLVAAGMSNREIAERLVIAKRTVDSHLEHILAKLGFTSRTQIAAWAARGSKR